MQAALVENMFGFNGHGIFHNDSVHFAYAANRTDCQIPSLMPLHGPPFIIPPSHRRDIFEKTMNTTRFRGLKAIPDSFDWRDTDMVAPVRAQGGHCNSCYVLTAADQLDFWEKKQSGSMGISPQGLLNCAKGGCSGGLMEDIYKEGPFEKSTDVFHKKVEKCKHTDSGWKVLDFVVLSDLEGEAVEPHLADAVYHYGPIPVGVDSTSSRFITYKSGIIKPDECNKVPNHAVTVVGYTLNYWIVKNSWGTEWGENGFAKISRGHDACGISSYTSFVTQVSGNLIV